MGCGNGCFECTSPITEAAAVGTPEVVETEVAEVEPTAVAAGEQISIKYSTPNFSEDRAGGGLR